MPENTTLTLTLEEQEQDTGDDTESFPREPLDVKVQNTESNPIADATITVRNDEAGYEEQKKSEGYGMFVTFEGVPFPCVVHAEKTLDDGTYLAGKKTIGEAEMGNNISA